MTYHLDSEVKRLFKVLVNLDGNRVYRFPPFSILWRWMSSNIQPVPSQFELKLACDSGRDLLKFLEED